MGERERSNNINTRQRGKTREIEKEKKWEEERETTRLIQGKETKLEKYNKEKQRKRKK